MTGADNAGVIVRPPLLYAVALAAMLALRWLWPLPIFSGAAFWPGAPLAAPPHGLSRWGGQTLRAPRPPQSPLHGSCRRVPRPHAGARYLVGDHLAGAGLDRHAPGRHPARGALSRAEVRRRIPAVSRGGSPVSVRHA